MFRPAARALARLAACALVTVPGAALVMSPSPARAQSPAGYYRLPAVHGDTVVFTAEGDLWIVPLGGGVARRLTTHLGEESHAAISPDGKTVAFSASYEGPTEVYTMPLAGGLPTRRTWEGGTATVVGWSPDGKVLYDTRRYATLPDAQLATVDPRSGAIDRIPLAQASDGSYDPSGKTLFFTRFPFQGSNTKRYEGGTAQNIWKYTAGAPEAVELTSSWPGTSRTPMPWQGRLYFVSDRDGTLNLWSSDESGGELKQLTHHVGWDVLSPSLADGHIVYQLGADLWRYDIAAGTDSIIPVRLASDFDQMREKWITDPMAWVTAVDLSPTGDRVVLTARGQVFVAPVGPGRLVEVPRQPLSRYRGAHFMPDGKTLVALSDASGEVELWTVPANGVGQPAQLTTGAKVLRWDGVPSPDGKWIAHYDKDQQLWLYDVRGHRSTRIATSDQGDFSDLAWSPDSRWLAYAAPAESNGFQRIFLYDVASGKTTPATTDRFDSYSPAWSPDGKWLYFLSDRAFESVVRAPWGPRQPEPYFDRTTRIYALALQRDERSPFEAMNELTAAQADSARAHADSLRERGGPAAKEKTTPGPVSRAARVAIDLDGLTSRITEVPVAPGDYAALTTDGKRLFWLSRERPPVARTVSDRPAQPPGAKLLALPISNEPPAVAEVVMDGVRSYALSLDARKLLVRKGNDLYVFDAGTKAPSDLSRSQVDLKGWSFAIDPREEWRQMFDEAWRLERDYFYDRGMNGIDWKAMHDKYLPLVARVTDREELSDILAQMIGELSALHMFVYGGDMRHGSDHATPGSLGAVLARDPAAGGWRVSHIYETDPDVPDERSPLARPGVNVAEGDVITLINGTPTLDLPDPAAALENQGGREVLLRVKPARGGATRDVIVTALTPQEDAGLRYDEWEYTRRERVDSASGGQIGYVHLRAMGPADIDQWARDFYPVFDREGLIIDMRHNRGGNIDSWILEKLMRKAWFYWQPRVGRPYWNMQFAFRGHMVVLTDQFTASDGEAFSEGFKRLGLGKVIGMRTWGGEIWLSSSNVLVDRGIATAAENGVYGPEGHWLIEGHGVDPDIVVDDPPHATFAGKDAQLDAAIAYLQQQIREHPVTVPAAPKYPDKSLPHWKADGQPR